MRIRLAGGVKFGTAILIAFIAETEMIDSNGKYHHEIGLYLVFGVPNRILYE